LEAQEYDKLVKALRICSSELNCGDCPLLYRDSCSSDELMADAAAAIEELEDALADECSECDYLVNENARLTTENNELRDNVKQAAAAIEELQFELDCVNDSVKMLSLPIDGKWIRVENGESYHYECSECGERPLYSRYGDVVLSGVCPMCGAKMEEAQE
jgi:hypothetical protein